MSAEYFLKPVYSRKLKSGKWIVLAEGALPLVVDEELAIRMVQNKDSLNEYDENILNILKENGFYTDTAAEIKSLPEENNSLKWNILRKILFIVGILSIISVLLLIPMNGIINGSSFINDSVPLLVNLLYIIIFSFLTSLFHEFMHIFFSQSFGYRLAGLRFNFYKAKATVSMSHIWIWTFQPRLAALSAGLIFDIFLLACFSIGNMFFTNWMVSVAITILSLRIIWQFRFHKNCDGQLIALSILDNPMLAIEQTDIEDNDIRIWKFLKTIGYFVDIYIVIFWVVPFFWRLIQIYF